VALGISGYETYFNHPDEMFYALSAALPYLKPETAAAVRKFLAGQLLACPPYAPDGFDNTAGRPREAYDVPEGIRVKGRGKAASAFGVYAFWSYCRRTGDKDAAARHLPAVRRRMAPLLDGTYSFEPAARHTNDEAERLNGDLAGLVGLARLARMAGQEDDPAVLDKIRELLGLRVNLERTNPAILEPTRAATKQLHNVRLARYADLVPEVALEVAVLSDGAARDRVQAFREARNAWHLAFTERLVGGENYVSPPHMGRAMMAAACFIEDLPPEQYPTFIDVPWCKGDFYFIEKCAYALLRSAGNREAGP